MYITKDKIYPEDMPALQSNTNLTYDMIKAELIPSNFCLQILILCFGYQQDNVTKIKRR